MRVSVDANSCLSSQLSPIPEENRARTIVVRPTQEEGSQGKIYEVLEVDGKQRRGLLAKSFPNGIPTNLREIISVVANNRDEVLQCPALVAMPLFLFEGVTSSGNFSGYIMRKVEGESFNTILENDLEDYINLPLEARLNLCLQFAHGMHILYALTIIHADLNGQNIILDTANQRLAIIDLDGGAVAKAGSAPITVGKWEPGWLAPEILFQLLRTTRLQAVDVRITADLWSIACGVHHLFFGLSPFFFIAKQPDILKYLKSYRWPQLRGLKGIATANTNAFDYYEKQFNGTRELGKSFRVSFQEGYLSPSRRIGAYQWMQAVRAELYAYSIFPRIPAGSSVTQKSSTVTTAAHRPMAQRTPVPIPLPRSAQRPAAPQVGFHPRLSRQGKSSAYHPSSFARRLTLYGPRSSKSLLILVLFLSIIGAAALLLFLRTGSAPSADTSVRMTLPPRPPTPVVLPSRAASIRKEVDPLQELPAWFQEMNIAVPRDNYPPPIYEDIGACPFECCKYGRWNVVRPVALMADWRSPSSATVAETSAGEEITALTGVVITVRPGLFQVVSNFTLAGMRLNAGDVVYALTNKGEGFVKAYFRGFVVEDIDVSWKELKHLRDAESQWWVQIKTEAGVIGWTSDIKSFGGIDACGADVVERSEAQEQEPVGQPIAASSERVPVQLGTVTTCSAVRNWRDYTSRTEFMPGERLFVYAEALNVNRDDKIDLSLNFVVFGSDGAQIGSAAVPVSTVTSDSSWASWPSFAIPADAHTGAFTAKVEVHNNLTGQSGRAFTTFMVLAPPKAPAAPQATPSSASQRENERSYSGPSEGAISWSGEINSTVDIVIENGRANIGVVQGNLPGVVCEITVLSQTGPVAIVEPPMPTNNYSRIVARIDGRGRQSFSLRWKVISPTR